MASAFGSCVSKVIATPVEEVGVRRETRSRRCVLEVEVSPAYTLTRKHVFSYCEPHSGDRAASYLKMPDGRVVSAEECDDFEATVRQMAKRRKKLDLARQLHDMERELREFRRQAGFSRESPTAESGSDVDEIAGFDFSRKVAKATTLSEIRSIVVKQGESVQK